MGPDDGDSGSLVDDASLLRAVNVFVAEEGVTSDERESAGCLVWDVCATSVHSASFLIEHGLIEALEEVVVKGDSGRQQEVAWGILASLCTHTQLSDMFIQEEGQRGSRVLPLALAVYCSSADPDVLRELTRLLCALVSKLSSRQQGEVVEGGLWAKLLFVLESSLQADLLAHTGKLAYLLCFYSPQALAKALAEGSLEGRVMRVVVGQGEELGHERMGRFSGIEYLLRCLEVLVSQREEEGVSSSRGLLMEEEVGLLCFLERLLTDGPLLHDPASAVTVAVVMDAYLSLHTPHPAASHPAASHPAASHPAAACTLPELCDACLGMAEQALALLSPSSSTEQQQQDPALLLLASLELLATARASSRYPGPDCLLPPEGGGGVTGRLARVSEEAGRVGWGEEEEMQQRFEAVQAALCAPRAGGGGKPPS